jgi:hypothetical protein
MKLKLLSVLFIVLIMISHACAQSVGIGRSGGILPLLVRSDVRKDLKMTKPQIERIDRLYKDITSDMQTLAESNQRPTSSLEREMRDLSERYDKQAIDVLDPTQRTRIREIQIQIDGNRSILRPEIQRSLGMTPAQTRQAREIEAKEQRALLEKMKAATELTDADVTRMVRDMDVRLNRSLEAVLNANQKKKLNGLRGAPFKQDKQDD